jgi:UDP-3-O-[3-hydroxymyristoyl] N-acetylglucosamine deacetylase
MPSDLFSAQGLISFAHPGIGEQAACCLGEPSFFRREIAPARTFCTSGEIESILAHGLGKGGTDENVIVVHDDGYSVPLRFQDEFIRHKLLDLIGDLSLLGGRLHAEVTAIKSSHTLNSALARKIQESSE